MLFFYAEVNERGHMARTRWNYTIPNDDVKNIGVVVTSLPWMADAPAKISSCTHSVDPAAAAWYKAVSPSSSAQNGV